MEKVLLEVDKVYKQHFGKLVASLLYSSKDINPESAEDIVHDAFSAAVIAWRSNGVPLNSVGWVYKVCKHKALNAIRKKKQVASLEQIENLQSVEVKFSESILDDYQLKLLFACAHPDLSPKIQVVITLKYVTNLKVEAIARVLGMTIDGVDKLLLRARQKIKDEKILLEEPEPSAFASRLPSVHKIIYLIFNEGYKSSCGSEMLREELCEEALLMNKALLDSPLGNKDTAALHALMLFNSARFKCRFGLSGELIDLEGQDRSLWDRDLILLACDFLTQSHSTVISSYHLEASISYLHCTAESFHSTNWILITKLYAQLLQGKPNPFIQLNQAIAQYYAGQKNSAFQLLHELQGQTVFSQYCLLNTTLGKFYHLEGYNIKAKEFLLKAHSQTNFAKEREFIQKMVKSWSNEQ
jgi:RNA polymerase sigma-70 factor (ECF subfamily)